MTTRLDLRTSLRKRLEDTTGSPLWDDALLNDVLAEAVRSYGARFPAERSTSAIVVDGAQSIPIAASSGRVLRVFDPNGCAVARLESLHPESGRTEQAWREWNSALMLNRPALGGNWTLESLTGRELPGDDVTAVELIPGDDEIVILGACASVLR